MIEWAASGWWQFGVTSSVQKLIAMDEITWILDDIAVQASHHTCMNSHINTKFYDRPLLLRRSLHAQEKFLSINLAWLDVLYSIPTLLLLACFLATFLRCSKMCTYQGMPQCSKNFAWCIWYAHFRLKASSMSLTLKQHLITVQKRVLWQPIASLGFFLGSV